MQCSFEGMQGLLEFFFFWITLRLPHAMPQVFIHNSFECGWFSVGFFTYGVATITRLLKIIGLFCRISSLL